MDVVLKLGRELLFCDRFFSCEMDRRLFKVFLFVLENDIVL